MKNLHGGESFLFNCGRSNQLISRGPVRIQSIKEASFKKQDGLFTNINQNITVYFHKSCVSKYTRKTHIKRPSNRNYYSSSAETLQKRLKRSDVKTFDFKTNCFYCGEECLVVDPKYPDRWRQYSLVRLTDRPNKSSIQAILENCD